MSVPPNLSLDPEVTAARVPARSGELAALVGAPPAGTPRRAAALLVPGYTGSKEDFLPVLGPLARAGHPVVAIDLRGQYESSGPDDPSAYTLAALAADVSAVLAGLAGPAGPAHLLGHSFGGLVTRRAVLDGARPRSLTLLGSGPGALGGRRGEIVGLMRLVLADGGIAALADAAEAVDRDDPTMASVPDEVRAFLRRRWLATAPAGLVVMGEELTTAVDETDALAATALPVLVVHGTDDDAWPPAEQKQMAERLGARYAVVAGAAHSPACEAPEGLVEVLLGWWRDQESAAAGGQPPSR